MWVSQVSIAPGRDGGTAEPVILMPVQVPSEQERMFRARRGPRYQAWLATSTSFDAAAAQLDILVTLLFGVAVAR
jgi:hypothetical protein